MKREDSWVETSEAYGEEEIKGVSPLFHHGQCKIAGKHDG